MCCWMSIGRRNWKVMLIACHWRVISWTIRVCWKMAFTTDQQLNDYATVMHRKPPTCGCLDMFWRNWCRKHIWCDLLIMKGENSVFCMRSFCVDWKSLANICINWEWCTALWTRAGKWMLTALKNDMRHWISIVWTPIWSNVRRQQTFVSHVWLALAVAWHYRRTERRSLAVENAEAKVRRRSNFKD